MSIKFINGMSIASINKELEKIIDISEVNELEQVMYDFDVFNTKKDIFDIDDNSFISLKLFNEIILDRHLNFSINISQDFIDNSNIKYKLLTNDKVSNNYKLNSLMVTINNYEYEFENWMFNENILLHDIYYFINDNKYFCLQLNNEKCLVFNDDTINNITNIEIFCR